MQTLCAFLCMLPLHLELFPSPWNYFWLDTYRCVAVFFLVISVTPLIFTWQFSRRAVEIQLCWHSSVLLWLDCKQDPVFCSQSRWWEILKIEKKFHAMNDRDLIFGLKSQKSGHCLLKDTFLLIMSQFLQQWESNVGRSICWSTTGLCWKQAVAFAGWPQDIWEARTEFPGLCLWDTCFSQGGFGVQYMDMLVLVRLWM